jgi:hypothetical protein
MTSDSVKTCSKQFCRGFFIPKGERWTRKVVAKISKKNAKTFKYTAKQKKDLEKTCKLHYCNPECKGTIFQKGKTMPVLEELKTLKGSKKNKNWFRNFTQKMRKNIFKGKTNVLKNGFYEKLPSKTRKLLQEKGALSGCASVVLGV